MSKSRNLSIIDGISRRVAALAALLAFAAVSFVLPAASFACECDEPVVIDGDEAYARSFREGRDPVEGFWGIYLNWQPEKDAARSYRMAIVKNDYGVYPEADYIGVATCGKPGCNKGEVKLLLKKTGDPREFEATLLVSDTDGGKGVAVLGRHGSTGRDDSALDLSALKYNGRRMSRGMVRIIGG
jgi:hypothetical protein